MEPRPFLENSLFSCGVYLGKQLLQQINNCCREVMQNNKMTSLIFQLLLDACSILKIDYQIAVLI